MKETKIQTEKNDIKERREKIVSIGVGHRRKRGNGMISNKKVVECAKVVAEYCEEQQGCQNCIFRLFGCENWRCAIGAFEIQTVLDNIEAKKKKGGYI